MGDKNKHLHSLIQKVLDSPIYKAVQRHNQNIDRFRSPMLNAWQASQLSIGSLKSMNDLIFPLRHINYYSNVSGMYIDYFRKTQATAASLNDLIARIQRTNLSSYEFDDDEELDVEEIELLTDSSKPKILLLNEVKEAQGIIQSVYDNNENIYLLQPRDFEEMIVELLRGKGFNVQLTKQTRDGGTDIIALQNLAGIPIRLLVECKRFAKKRKVGVDIIRSFSHVISRQNANKGLIVTSSYFSSDAHKEQQLAMPYQLDLKDYYDVITWVNDHVKR